MEITPRQWLIALLIAGLAHAALAYALVQATLPVATAPNGIRLQLGAGGQPAQRGSDAQQGAGALRPLPAERGNGITQALEPLSAVTLGAEVSSNQSAEPLSDDRVGTRVPDGQLVATSVPTKPAASSTPSPSASASPRSSSSSRPERGPKPASKPARESIPEPAAEPLPLRQATQPSVAATHQQRQEQIEPNPVPPRRSTASDDYREQTIAKARAKPGQGQRAPRGKPAPTALPDATTRGSTGAHNSPGAGNDVAEGQPGGDRGRTDGSDGGRGKGGSGTPHKGGGGQADARNYYGRLATWLARHKRYPLQARRLGQEGTVKVTFTVSRSGRVLAKRITQSSGHPLLDREAQAMLDRASPLPRIPSSLGRDSLTVSLPVAFALR